jgi:hypothetical protein
MCLKRAEGTQMSRGVPLHPLEVSPSWNGQGEFDMYVCYENLKINRTIILPVVLYGCETWSLKLREEHRLRVFENRVLRRIFGSERSVVKWDWRKLHNAELNEVYCLLNIVRVIKLITMRWVGHVACMGR